MSSLVGSLVCHNDLVGWVDEGVAWKSGWLGWLAGCKEIRWSADRQLVERERVAGVALGALPPMQTGQALGAAVVTVVKVPVEAEVERGLLWEVGAVVEKEAGKSGSCHQLQKW